MKTATSPRGPKLWMLKQSEQDALGATEKSRWLVRGFCQWRVSLVARAWLLHQTSQARGVYGRLKERTYWGRLWGGWTEGKDLLVLASTVRGKESIIRWLSEEDSNAGLHRICFSSTIPSRNSYNLNNLFYLVACHWPCCTQSKAT